MKSKGYKVKDENEIESLKKYIGDIYEDIKEIILENKIGKIEMKDIDLENISGGKEYGKLGIPETVLMVSGGIVGTAISASTIVGLFIAKKKKRKEIDESMGFAISIGSLLTGALAGAAAGAGVGYLIDKNKE